MKRFREPLVEFAMQPADELGPVDIHRFPRQSVDHELLHRDVGEAQLLVVALGFVG